MHRNRSAHAWLTVSSPEMCIITMYIFGRCGQYRSVEWVDSLNSKWKTKMEEMKDWIPSKNICISTIWIWGMVNKCDLIWPQASTRTCLPQCPSPNPVPNSPDAKLPSNVPGHFTLCNISLEHSLYSLTAVLILPGSIQMPPHLRVFYK